MMNFVFLTLFVALGTSPYSGQEQREIKSLSHQQIQAYLDGKGQGLAKAAELNQYPGPLHVLELKEKLKLSKQQILHSKKIWHDMDREAKRLGKRVIDYEKRLDLGFRDKSIDANSLEKLTRELGLLKGKLRYTHLHAHILQRSVLSDSQVKLYDRLRGYQGPGASHHHAHP